jgi:hypothetical protein
VNYCRKIFLNHNRFTEGIMILTKDALRLGRRRGFPPVLMDIILSNGHYRKTSNGSELIIFGRREAQALVKEAKRIIQIADQANRMTIMLKEGVIIKIYKS